MARSGIKNVRAVLALRGGYVVGEDFTAFLDAEAYLEDPTWIVGFSDITALHLVE